MLTYADVCADYNDCGQAIGAMLFFDFYIGGVTVIMMLFTYI